MAKRRPERPDGNADRTPTRRDGIDAAVSALINEFRHRLEPHQRSPVDALRLAARAAERARGTPLHSPGKTGVPELTGLARDAADYAVWAANRAAGGTAPGGNDPPVEEVRRALLRDELRIFRADAEGPAVLELTRVAFQLLGAVAAHPGNPRAAVRAAASAAAHAVMAVQCGAGDEPAAAQKAAILADFRAFPWEGEVFPPLWAGQPPRWAAEADAERPLTTARKRVQSRLMPRRQAPSPSRPEPPPESATLPGPADPREAVAHAQAHIAELRRQGIERLQHLLNALTGHSLGSYEEHKRLAEDVSKLVKDIGAVLLLSDEYEDAKGDTKVYTLRPVKIRCEHPNVASFKVRTADRASSYVTSTTMWPQLYAELRESPDVTPSE
jgi:hypothetical protein